MSAGSTEGYEYEPVRGLPGHLPAGEHIIWQGAPDWKRLALTAFHVRGVAIYFGLILIWAAIAGTGLTGFAITLLAGLAAVGLLGFLAFLSARSSVYTLTNRRIVLRIGIALPTCINIPLKIIGTAALKQHPDGTADIPLQLTGPDRLGWLTLWPHARPWKVGTPEPMLRAVPEGKNVALMLAQALATEVPAAEAQYGRRTAVAVRAVVDPSIAEAQAA